MKQKILIALGLLIILIVGGMWYLDHRNKTLSPPGKVELSTEKMTVKVDYSRPSVRGREIFGEGENYLLPYGVYWRLGANEATQVDFSTDVLFNGKALEAGTYTLYAVPNSSYFEIGVNREINRWGYAEPDYAQDVFRTEVPARDLEKAVEQFTINLLKADGGGVDMLIKFETTEFSIPVRPLE